MFATTKSQQMLNASNAVVAFHGLEMAAEGYSTCKIGRRKSPVGFATAEGFPAIPSAVAKPTGFLCSYFTCAVWVCGLFEQQEWQRPKQGLRRLKNCLHSNDLPSG